MKKYFIGFIIGVFLTLPLSVFAENVSNVGKKTAAEFTVKLDGEELPVKAVALEGTSFAPVRAVGEALGLDVDFRDGVVILTRNNDKNISHEEIKKILLPETKEEKIERLQSHLKSLEESTIPSIRLRLEINMHNLDNARHIENEEARERSVQQMEERVSLAQTELDEFLNLKSEIEAELEMLLGSLGP